MKFTVYNPVRVVFGNSKINEVGPLAMSYGKHPLVVSMSELADAGILEPVFVSLEKAGCTYTLFDDLINEPKTEDIEKVVKIARHSECDVIIGVGGGSCMDTAKATAIAVNHPEEIWEYVNLSNRPPKPIDIQKVLPVIAVPTTAGTGSEVTPYAVITNSHTVQKGTIKDASIFPVAALIDPELTHTLPLHLTASTGIDAFAHALESYFNVPNRSPWSDMLVEDALGRIVQNLPLVCADGENSMARTQMAWASTIAGMAISHAGTTVAHALAQPLGARTGLSHGVTVSIFLAAVIGHTLPADMSRIARIARILGAPCGLDDSQAAVLAESLINDFVARTGVSFKISDQFAAAEPTLIEDLARDVATYMSRPLNQHPKVFSFEELKQIVAASF